MKKLITIIFFLTVFMVAGCGNTTKTNTSTINTTNSTNTTIKTSKETKSMFTTSKKKEGNPIAVGIWHRPNVLGNETTLEGIQNTLDIFKRCGINIVYLETIYHGMAIYKSKFIPYYSGFEFFDYGEYKDYLSAFT